MNSSVSAIGISVGILSAFSLSQSVNAQKTSTQEKPNIIFIIADDMGYGDLACYGNRVIKTPNIDKLAKQGIRFTQAYAGSSVSSPSRCCLLTGKNTGHSRIRDNFAVSGGITGDKNGKTIRRVNLLETDTTIALMLRSAGYHSMLINKWHLDGFNPNAGPIDRGFDEFKGWLISFPESNLPYYYPSHRFNNRQMVEITENVKNRQGIHCNDLSTNEAVEFIERNIKNHFFLYLAFDTPHEPYVMKDLGIYKNMQLTDTSKTYAALITNLDRNVGKIIKALDDKGLKNNTVIFFISDNGGAVMAPHRELKCNGNLRGVKGTLYEGGIRVPLIACWPGKFASHITSDMPVYFPDFMPTIAALTGATTPGGMDGISLLPVLSGKMQKSEDRFLYWEFPGKTQALRWGKWKFIRTEWNKAPELYDLSTDISEKHNIADLHPDIIETINKYIETHRSESENWPTTGN